MNVSMRQLPSIAVGVALSCVAAVGCGGGSTSPTSPTPTPTSHVGRYNLITAKGQPLPAVVYQGSTQKQEVVGGFVELREGTECAWATDYRYTDESRTWASSSGGTGTYTLSGSRVVLTVSGGQLVGTLAGDTLTITADVELVYRK